jgi:uncharacterized protein YbaA (DUF1428 family)
MAQYVDGYVLPVSELQCRCIPPHRDRVNVKVVMKVPRRTDTDPKLLPFDCNRMVYDGFKVLVAA